MNAAIALCSFCEVHGPRVIFTTQTYKNFNYELQDKLKFYGSKEIFKQGQTFFPDLNNDCEGCNSLGNVKFLSNEHETRTSFLSARQSLAQDIVAHLKHACIRSLSCEVHDRKEGVCYFGDESRGHVLSRTFSLKDAQARGLRRWCSFIVFMRDKQFLLNMWTFFVDNLHELVKELQTFAERKYTAEEAKCSQRVIRLATSNEGTRGTYNKQPRALSEITNEKYLFVRIHMWFVWILSAGARHFIEVLPLSLIDEDVNYSLEHLMKTEGFNLVNAKPPINISLDGQIPEFSKISNVNPTTILRNLRRVIGHDQFRQILYAVLIGIQILVRGPPGESLLSLYALSSLVPRACQRVKTNASEYLDDNVCNFISVDTSVAVPLPCSEVCRLDILPLEHRTENVRTHVVRWKGNVPSKLPTLMSKLEKSLENEKLVDSVLRVHFATLKEEWLNIAKIVHAMRGQGRYTDSVKVLISLGAGPQDKKILKSWSMGLPSNPA